MKLFTYLLLFIGLNSFAQNMQLIDGRVRFSDGIQRKVTIYNKTNGQEVNADSTGFFSINVTKGDVLLFKTDSFLDRSLTIKGNEGEYLGVILSEHELDEIVIDKKVFVNNYFGDIDKYTAGERRYRSANNLLFKDGITGFGLDPLMNLLNGKRKKQKKELFYEEQEFQKERFLEVFTTSVLNEEFGITEDAVTGFAYFIVVQPGFNNLEIDLSPEFKLYVSEMYAQYIK